MVFVIANPSAYLKHSSTGITSVVGGTATKAGVAAVAAASATEALRHRGCVVTTDMLPVRCGHYCYDTDIVITIVPATATVKATGGGRRQCDCYLRMHTATMS